jgi:hypothetical protein
VIQLLNFAGRGRDEACLRCCECLMHSAAQPVSTKNIIKLSFAASSAVRQKDKNYPSFDSSCYVEVSTALRLESIPTVLSVGTSSMLPAWHSFTTQAILVVCQSGDFCKHSFQSTAGFFSIRPSAAWSCRGIRRSLVLCRSQGGANRTQMLSMSQSGFRLQLRGVRAISY